MKFEISTLCELLNAHVFFLQKKPKTLFFCLFQTFTPENVQLPEHDSAIKSRRIQKVVASSSRMAFNYFGMSFLRDSIPFPIKLKCRCGAAK